MTQRQPTHTINRTLLSMCIQRALWTTYGYLRHD